MLFFFYVTPFSKVNFPLSHPIAFPPVPFCSFPSFRLQSFPIPQILFPPLFRSFLLFPSQSTIPCLTRPILSIFGPLLSLHIYLLILSCPIPFQHVLSYSFLTSPLWSLIPYHHFNLMALLTFIKTFITQQGKVGKKLHSSHLSHFHQV